MIKGVLRKLRACACVCVYNEYTYLISVLFNVYSYLNKLNLLISVNVLLFLCRIYIILHQV